MRKDTLPKYKKNNVLRGGAPGEIADEEPSRRGEQA